MSQKQPRAEESHERKKAMRQKAVVICPGRGTYGKAELGYLQKYHRDKAEFISAIDRYRDQQGQASITKLDQAATFKPALHTTGDNASALIYACALSDFQSIDRKKFEIVAVTGNSMGWYLALACANVLAEAAALHVVNSMGTLMHNEARGGQIIYPLVNERWQSDPSLQKTVESTVLELTQQPDVEIYTSINLGGTLVLAANAKGIKLLLKKLPLQQNRYPFSLPAHGAFHSPLVRPQSARAKSMLPADLFSAPELPLIDGRGRIWQPYATDLDALYEYTFGCQVRQTYDYSKAVEVAIKEFAPDKIIILGPGTTLGPPTAQVLIQNQWLGLSSKQDFVSRQADDPFVLNMGRDDQRACVGAI